MAKDNRKNGNASVTDLKSAVALANLRDVFRFHGERPRGADFAPGSQFFEGRFGRMFRTLEPAEFSEDDLKKLAHAMVAEPEEDPPSDDIDEEENQGISAGYTYLGQFIDHDLTFDPASSLQKQNDPEALEDYRTPRFDLDCVYGRGPNDQPYLYEDDGVHMLQGRELHGNDDDRTRDLPRNERGRALIGDPRNDENVIVSQLQGIMLRFHNRVVKYLQDKGVTKPDFEMIQNIVRWHYQWVVLHDFLPTVAGHGALYDVLPHLRKETSIHVDKPNVTFFHWHKSAFMPIEFSAAAYRFGHSMVRPFYRLNTKLRHKVIFRVDHSGHVDREHSLVGFRAFPDNWAIDWRLFFPMGDAPSEGPHRLQKSYKIDTSLVNPLGNLPEIIGANTPSLAERNLIRGWRMGLPSGQSIARYMDIPVIRDDELMIGKAVAKPHPPNKSIAERFPNLNGNAPLWFYVLSEAHHDRFNGDNATPIRLGRLGGRIVVEVFVGLLLHDPHSFLSQYPSWRPFKEFTSDGTENGEFRMADLIKQAQLV